MRNYNNFLFSTYFAFSSDRPAGVHHMFNTIETARLILRLWRTDDLKDLERLFADPAVRLGRHLPPERIIAIAESSLRQWQRNGFGPWAALDKATGQWIGRMGLDELDNWPDAHK